MGPDFETTTFKDQLPDREEHPPVHEKAPDPPKRLAKLEPTNANLEKVFRDIAASRTATIANRQRGVRFALANMKDADPPTLGEQVLELAAITGVGLVSGYISTRVTNGIDKLGKARVGRRGAVSVPALSEAVKAALQTAVDDGGKATFDAIRAGIKGKDDINAFFNSEEAGLEAMKLELTLKDSDRIAGVQNKLEKVGEQERADLLDAAIAHAEGVLDVLRPEEGTSENEQYGVSLSTWLGATAREDLGESEELGGTDLEDAVDGGPDVYRKARHEGVVYVNLGNRPASGRFGAGQVKVSGITSKALKPLRTSKIKDLRMPIVASGYVHDGSFVDGASLFNNEIAFGRNENWVVWIDGHENAIDALKTATGASRDTEAASIKLDEIADNTLEHAEAAK